MNRVAIVSAKRTAIGSFGGSLKDVSAAKIGGDLVKQALESINQILLMKLYSVMYYRLVLGRM